MKEEILKLRYLQIIKSSDVNPKKNDYYAIPYYSNATHEWWLRCKNWDDTTLYSKEVSFKVYYKPKP